MNRIIALLSFFIFAAGIVCAQDMADIPIRDPYVFPDVKTKTYYMYATRSTRNSKGDTLGGVMAYKSKDLKNWTDPVPVFTVPEDNWITGRVWAPEAHEYKGKYYLFATLNSDIEWKKKETDWPNYYFRGTQIFHADSPEGPFLPFDVVPHTPQDRMALDGTFWVENDIPYMIYCHEWVQTVDGTMELLQLAPDLSAPVGNSLKLFNASAADWSTGTKREGKPTSHVTDGCFVYRTKTGKLLMIWSSFGLNGYAVGIAESTTGKVRGPWKQQPDPLFRENGGHGMIFESFDEKLYMILHAPNSPRGSERAVLHELEDTGETLRLK